MKAFIAVLLIFSATQYLRAQQNPSPTPVATPVVVSSPVNTTVAVAAPAALPELAQQALVFAEKLPVVGPYVSKILLWIGIIATLMTTIVASLLSLLKILAGIASLSNAPLLVSITKFLTDLQTGKIMYYLQMVSVFNAKKPAVDPTVQPLAKAA